MKVVCGLCTLLFGVSLWMSNASLPPPPPPPVVDEVLWVMDVICGNLVETSTDWAVKAFNEREGHFFCSEECFAKYLELTRRSP